MAGVNQWDVDTPPKYISNTNLSARVGGLNPRWNEDSSSDRTDAQFQKAVQLTGSEFLNCLDYISKVALMSRVLHVLGLLPSYKISFCSGARSDTVRHLSCQGIFQVKFRDPFQITVEKWHKSPSLIGYQNSWVACCRHGYQQGLMCRRQ